MQELHMTPQKENFVRLAAAVKFAGFAETGGEAKLIIQDGKVTVNGEVCTQRGKKLQSGAVIRFYAKEVEVLIDDGDPAPC